MNKLALLLVAAVLAADPALATGRDPKPDPDKVVCRNEPVLGTRLTRKRCLTVGQWAEMRRESRELVEKLQQIADIAGSK